MNKHEEKSELDDHLQKNKEISQALQSRLSEIQREEDVYRSDLRSCIGNIEKISSIAKGSVFVQIQYDAQSYVDDLREKVERAFDSEREQVREGLRSLESERDVLLKRRNALEEEEE